MSATLVRNALLPGRRGPLDVHIAGGRIAAIGPELAAGPEERIIDANGASLLPGLHDHHIHLLALAAAGESLHCGPPAVATGQALANLLRTENEIPGRGWLRGIGYHPSVAGEIDREWLDRLIPARPVRIQHRGGRLWVLNSLALQLLTADDGEPPPGLECIDGRPSGRLYEGDAWLRERLPRKLPDPGAVSATLASCGVTGLTDTTPSNGPFEWQYFRECQERGQLLQSVRMMGSTELNCRRESARLTRGELKLHLLENRLPAFEDLCGTIESAHIESRAVAVHCVTLAELVFALGALEQAGVVTGDRIEHASVCPPDQLARIRELGLRVVTQPHFVAERGDQYLAEVDERDRPWLYRAAGFLQAGIPLAGGSDAPFGSADPWRAMRAAVERTTPTGEVIGAGEALTPEQALQLFLSPADRPGLGAVAMAVGLPADLCLLDGPWSAVREQLSSEHVRCTWRAGELIYESG